MESSPTAWHQIVSEMARAQQLLARHRRLDRGLWVDPGQSSEENRYNRAAIEGRCMWASAELLAAGRG